MVQASNAIRTSFNYNKTATVPNPSQPYKKEAPWYLIQKYAPILQRFSRQSSNSVFFVFAPAHKRPL
jgi:hypothetical protein